MVKVTVGTTLGRKAEIFPKETTIREILTKMGVDYSRGTMNLDGAPLVAGELNKTLLEFGYDGTEHKNEALLINVVKADNAVSAHKILVI